MCIVDDAFPLTLPPLIGTGRIVAGFARAGVELHVQTVRNMGADGRLPRPVLVAGRKVWRTEDVRAALARMLGEAQPAD